MTFVAKMLVKALEDGQDYKNSHFFYRKYFAWRHKISCSVSPVSWLISLCNMPYMLSCPLYAFKKNYILNMNLVFDPESENTMRTEAYVSLDAQ
jgi:hypothetical protein